MGLRGSSGDGGGGGITAYQIGTEINDQTIDNTIEYCCPFGQSLASEALRKYAMPEAGTLKSMMVWVELSSGETNGVIYTLRINGVDTALTLTQTLNTTGVYEVAADVAVAKEDLIGFEVDNTGNFGGTRTGSISCLFEPSA